jgi:hypothetical protein
VYSWRFSPLRKEKKSLRRGEVKTLNPWLQFFNENHSWIHGHPKITSLYNLFHSFIRVKNIRVQKNPSTFIEGFEYGQFE